MTANRFLQSAWVVGRRDFVATVFSKTFLLFLIGPLLPLAFGVLFGGIGARANEQQPPDSVAVIADTADFALLQSARTRFEPLAEGRPLIALK